jgi:cytochrome c biogenesis protein CcmG/thiol:disulfide interchange protein DsbE
MYRAFLLSLLVVASASAYPTRLDRLNVGSQTYTNVTIVSVSATDLYFSYQKGIKNVKLRLLDSETQKLFNYDPKAAQELEKEQAQGDAKFQSSVGAHPAGGAAASALANAAEEKRKMSSEDNLADPISEQSLLGKPGPAIALQKWLGSAAAPTLKGKFVLVTFWTPWSLPCQKWIPQLNALQKKFADKLDVIGFVPEADADDRSMDAKVEFPFATDEKGKYQVALRIKAVPSVVLMDPAGVVLYEGHPAALGEKELKTFLARPASETR